jgi:hypothetical protein
MKKIMLMKDYSNKKINFSNLNLQKIIVFLETIKTVQSPSISFVTKKFQNTFNGFNDILAFSVMTGIVEILDNKLKLKYKLPTEKNDFKDFLLKAIFKNTFYRESELERFINCFVVKNKQYWFSADRKIRLKTSGIRNFLIDIGFLGYSEKNDNYFVSEKGFTYLSLILNQKNLTPYELSKKLKSIEELGVLAEQVILKYEKSRLKKFPQLLSQIKHISQGKVNAGYDIQSYTFKSNITESTPRYIEVKAVSELDNKFYWSRNELAVAENLGNEYYLYLLPVKANKSFDIKNLLIIQNPHKKVFKNKDEWKSEVELISFTHNKIYKETQKW